jgi:hypothetical protein
MVLINLLALYIYLIHNLLLLICNNNIRILGNIINKEANKAKKVKEIIIFLLYLFFLRQFYKNLLKINNLEDYLMIMIR